MKRSEINAIMLDADAFVKEHGFHLPPFSHWTPKQWAGSGSEVREIIAHSMGWDITDFGLGDYEKCGLFLFTIRNGAPENLKTGRGKVYAEKIMIVNVDQIIPTHFHRLKAEDIINRGGGKLIIQLFNSDEQLHLLDTDVAVSVDGVQRMVGAGETVTLSPGESITLLPYCAHKFWGAEHRVLVGEVSSVNDDQADNFFIDQVARFPSIDEDEQPLYLLIGDYPKYYQPNRVG